MQIKSNSTSNINPGVRCVVNTCHYYSEGDHCTAQRIEVQHRNAQNAQETDCATFKPCNSFK
jgi:hypothetical protein